MKPSIEPLSLQASGEQQRMPCGLDEPLFTNPVPCPTCPETPVISAKSSCRENTASPPMPMDPGQINPWDSPPTNKILFSDGSSSCMMSCPSVTMDMPETQNTLTRIASFCTWPPEKPRIGALARIITSRWFELATMTVIALNTACTIVATYQEGSDQNDVSVPDQISELSFLIFYVFELGLRIWVHRIYFFVGKDWRWNFLDLTLVMISTIEQILVVVLERNGTGFSCVVLRVCRMFKGVKIIRMVRAFTFLTDLRLMLDIVMGSFVTLFWSALMITFVVYIFAIYFTQSMAVYLGNETITDKDRADILFFFGDSSRSFLYLLQVTTGGKDWGDMYALISTTGWINSAAFILYVGFFLLAAWNIVTTLFIDKAMKLAQPNAENEMLEMQHADEADAALLLDVCRSLDLNNDSKLSYDEFRSLSKQRRFRAFFEARGLYIKDAALFYKMLAASGGTTDDICLQKFVKGCLKMKGSATSVDLHILKYEFHCMCEKQHDFWRFTSKHLDAIQSLLSDITVNRCSGNFPRDAYV